MERCPKCGKGYMITENEGEWIGESEHWHGGRVRITETCDNPACTYREVTKLDGN